MENNLTTRLSPELTEIIDKPATRQHFIAGGMMLAVFLILVLMTSLIQFPQLHHAEGLYSEENILPDQTISLGKSVDSTRRSVISIDLAHNSIPGDHIKEVLLGKSSPSGVRYYALEEFTYYLTRSPVRDTLIIRFKKLPIGIAQIIHASQHDGMLPVKIVAGELSLFHKIINAVSLSPKLP